jgi:hypothetical protein
MRARGQKTSVSVTEKTLDLLHRSRIVPGENLENVVLRGLEASRLVKLLEERDRDLLVELRGQIGVPA